MWWLLAWNTVLGLGHLISLLGEQSRIARSRSGSGGRSLDSLFGIYTFAGSLGQALAPALLAVVGGSAVLPATGPLFGWYLAAAVGVLAATAVMVARPRGGRAGRTGGEPGVVRGPDGGTAPAPRLRDALAGNPAARRPLVSSIGVSMMVLCAIDLLQVYLPALAVERGVPVAAVGALLTLRAVATMASRLVLGRLVLRLGRPRLILWATAAGALAVAAVAVPLPVWALGAVLAVAGYALGIVQPLTMTVVSLFAPPGTRLAARITANRLGQTAIPPAVGLLAGTLGAAGVFAATGLALGAAAGAWKAVQPRR
ncbi:MFS transporter [Sinomonas halotolerans]|uniref:MFS transporter n=1 Tax=Sinomonas halotolerans TaxID=1644133 RepID=A0ABU9X1D9_9MICC